MRPRKHTAESGQASAAALLDAADKILAEEGLGALTARTVAERAGVNKGLVFYHFQSKAGLLQAVLERYYAAHREALAHAFADNGAPIAVRLQRMVDAYFDFIAAHQRYPRIVQQQVSGGDPALVQANLQPLLAWFEGVLAELTPTAGPLAARQFFLTFSGMVINYFTYGPTMAEAWGADPLSPEGIAERRAHVHWMVDAVLAKLAG
ncbi:MAG: TetR/AcrR family transcriptional regulator [Myxococcales bacterium]|nr:TetR/AcrR family transcriptional regulator [Myxococcales bacterium]